MNTTEVKADKWLRTQGEAPIFQFRKSPDFICPNGEGYEAKLLRKNAITFSETQWEALTHFPSQLTVLVFNNGDNPIHIIPFAEIKSRPIYWGHIRIAIYDWRAYSEVSIRNIDKDLWAEAKIDAVKKHKTMATWIAEAISGKLTQQ